MARIVKHNGDSMIHTETAPAEIKVGGESVWFCRCGLSTGKPYCSGAHKQTAGEEADKLYKYENGKRVEVKSL